MRLLITGATGLVGTRIMDFCEINQIQVHYLTRDPKKIKNTEFRKGFLWNPEREEVDVNCLEGVEVIINLAGANLFHYWTKSYKQKIVKSRLQSLTFLYKILQEKEQVVEQLISASAIGIYPHSFENVYTEETDNLASGFLGELVQKWEQKATDFSNLGIDVTCLRTGMVLAKDKGVFPLLYKTTKAYFPSVLGTGRQWQSWIHIDDLAQLYLFAALNRLDGVFNAVAPNPVTQSEFVHILARKLERKVWLPNILEAMVRAIGGEMSQLPLSSQLVMAKKIEKMGFRFQFSNLNKAIENLQE